MKSESEATDSEMRTKAKDYSAQDAVRARTKAWAASHTDAKTAERKETTKATAAEDALRAPA